MKGFTWTKTLLLGFWVACLLGVNSEIRESVVIIYNATKAAEEQEYYDVRDFMRHDKVFPVSKFPKADHAMPSLHRCMTSGEAFSGAYLVTATHFLKQYTDYNLNLTYAEMASFMMFRTKDHPFRDIVGTMMQSMDVLDFAVLHLSPYERLLDRYNGIIDIQKENITQKMIEVALHMKQKTIHLLKNARSQYRNNIAYDQTLVIIPYLGTHIGDGHSSLAYRKLYLQACVWSFALYYDHIVIGVANKEDEAYIRYCKPLLYLLYPLYTYSPTHYNIYRKESGLPIFDIIVFPDLQKLGSLPIVLIQAIKQRLFHHYYTPSSFQYIFFTEADHILLMRIGYDLYSYLNSSISSRRVLTPHRLHVYPDTVLTKVHHRTDTTNKEMTDYEQSEYQCCQARQYCAHRRYWLPVSHQQIPIVQLFGLLSVPLGNSNFMKEYYRKCTLYKDTNNSHNTSDSSNTNGQINMTSLSYTYTKPQRTSMCY